MDGEPVWLASVSTWKKGQLFPAERHNKYERRDAIALARTVLNGVGNQERERVFRMCITVCIHRALSEEEKANLKPSSCPIKNLAGAPVEIIEERGCVPSLSTLPCENYRKRLIVPARRDLWVPAECGACPTCLARSAIEGVAV